MSSVPRTYQPLPGRNQCLWEQQFKITHLQHLAAAIFSPRQRQSVSAGGRVEQVRRPSHSRPIPVKALMLCKRAGVGGGMGRRSQRGEGCSRRASDPEILRGFSSRRWKMCDTFQQPRFFFNLPSCLRCLFFFSFCTLNSEVCAPPPDRWIQWRCTVEPRGWTSFSSASSALVLCRWWWTRGLRRLEAHVEPRKQAKNLHKGEDCGV